ncbi:hypothetical protein FJV41_07010 [Myxococcus llanfairpwllgwyngyllgogerychwyrndrobwllllantysiliogogogochensis]|uniref:Uncharacterized protein n=1 Tax=Myxococcus llanfairpwllgwyngyllgogerychwyrndrobwllllantysiliogogogochensis TaxID=2590453 RepID=A0A540X694_9BACT|nr:hypothetical protein [Myxococcus llanfairpwllgwyngyllgogerychwyrndrobwllllantysiliogogogochensis]TQF16763.1 hypothetical protein FJV41_07010 [Myxococcus llanfairpwllgwyngyllgogerychwyrndrobwllllantysiliogogogochensis]
MPVERMAGSTSLVDVMDRVLDRGLRWDDVVHADRLSPEHAARVVVTYLEVRTDDTPRPGETPRPTPGA